MKNNYLVQAWLVLLLALCFGAALAGVDSTLRGRIQHNKLQDTMGQIPGLVPGAVSGEAEIVGDQTAYRAVDADGNHVGWVLLAKGQGFADKIELLVGLNEDISKITGLYILDQKETPGLGNKVTENAWRSQFIDKKALAGLSVTKAAPMNNEIEAITGATISSESVVSIVNRAITKFRASMGTQR